MDELDRYLSTGFCRRWGQEMFTMFSRCWARTMEEYHGRPTSHKQRPRNLSPVFHQQLMGFHAHSTLFAFYFSLSLAYYTKAPQSIYSLLVLAGEGGLVQRLQ